MNITTYLSRGRRWTVPIAVLCLLGILAAELALSIRQQTQTWDEAFHMLAGYRYWQSADFGINPEHPPLVKLLATVPLLYVHPRMPIVPRGTSKQEGFVSARKFLYANDADALLFRCRMAVSVFALLLALVLFHAVRQMFGTGAAFLALLLLVFEPNVLAHGALVTTDVALAYCLFSSVYTFYRYVKNRTALRLLQCGLVVGLTLAVKHSGILVFPILGMLAAAEIFMDSPPSEGPNADTIGERKSLTRKALRWAGAFAAITVVGLTFLWGCYSFRFGARPDGEAMTTSLADLLRGSAGTGLRDPLQSRLILTLAGFHFLPESYLYGLADVLVVSAGPRPAFLFGKLHPRGFWYYFPAAFLIKSTLGFLLLLLCALAAKPLREARFRREILCVTLPPLVYFAVSLSSGLNVGVRHLLPIYPFLIALTAAGAWELGRERRAGRYVVGALVALHLLSSVRSYPNYLAYSNELFGGPSKTYQVLTDSNVDSGQGLLAAKKYLDQHHISDCWLAYFGSADPDYYHLPCKLLPASFATWWGRPADIVPQAYTGTVLVGATELSGAYWGPGELNPDQRFQKVRPVDIVGGSILVYQGSFDLTQASAWSHADRAWELFAHKQREQAAAEARTAVALGPRMVGTHYALGYLLAAGGRKAEAQREYETALTLAQIIYPEYQWFWIPLLEKSLRVL